jgi:hypothetical protein
MNSADDVRDHEARCGPHLARLWMLCVGAADTPLADGVAGQVTNATSAILAEVKAAERAALAPAADGRTAGTRPLLAARLSRLEHAADAAVASARDGNAVTLRDTLRRFGTLTSAMWTVQLSACDEAAARARPGRGPSADGS